MQICEKNICTGCALCVNICNHKAIVMKPDEKGFLYPVIDSSKCVSCKLCQKKCPQNSELSLNSEGSVYAAMAKNDEIRKKSSSGGIFSIFAEWIINNQGVVIGAALMSDMSVCHISVSSIGELEKLRGSKYVQSEIGTIYQSVKDTLESGKKVLFSGTPCQVDGLYKFLGYNPENLITIDLLCHGTPSPNVFSKYISYIEDIYGKKVVNANFREKNPGWKDFHLKLIFDDGTTIIDKEHTYINGFLKNYFLRESCYKCKYTNKTRVGDITLGDYWGYKQSFPKFVEDDDNGISVIMLNTDKGKKLYSKNKHKMICVKSDIDDVALGNIVLSHSVPKAKNYTEFWCDYDNMEWKELSDRYFPADVEWHDPYTPEARAYYSIPYHRRHPRHLIHCWKLRLIDKIKRIKG